ncbi:hypothetical protein TNCV_1078701 [Trichonephila clavipes]|nr:hypothetical protein TNCV_1078701 [Trichonephila clavipes]
MSEASMTNVKTSQFDINPSHSYHRPCSYDRLHRVQFVIQLLTDLWSGREKKERRNGMTRRGSKMEKDH